MLSGTTIPLHFGQEQQSLDYWEKHSLEQLFRRRPLNCRTS